MAAGEYLQQLGAFVLLVGVQTFAILLFKLCQVNGAYTFSPASSVALTEMCKLVLLVYLAYLIELLLLDGRSDETGGE